MLDRLTRLTSLLVTLCTGVALVWTLTQNPFAQPLTERSLAEARLALNIALKQQLTPEWVAENIRGAIAADDPDSLIVFMELAADHDIILSDDIRAEAATYLEAQRGLLVQAGNCAICAYDIRACKTISQIAGCALPVEMTPIGDLNALRRAGVDWVTGEEIDKLDAGLAVAGLGATGLAIGTGGSSLTVKAGTALLRSAHRIKALTPGLRSVILDLVEGAVDWTRLPDYVLGRTTLAAVTDSNKLNDIYRISGDLDSIRVSTSTGEALHLLRYVDSAEDAARLARVTAAQGNRSRHTLEALGKSKTFRAMVRVSDAALLGIGLISALFIQAGNLLPILLRRLFRPMLRR